MFVHKKYPMSPKRQLESINLICLFLLFNVFANIALFRKESSKCIVCKLTHRCCRSDCSC